MVYGRGHVSAPGIIPVVLRPNVAFPVVLLCDDVERATDAGILQELQLTLSVDRSLITEIDVTFKLNGTVLNDPQLSEQQVVFYLTAPPLKQGVNTLEAVFKEGASADEITVNGVDLWVRYKKP